MQKAREQGFTLIEMSIVLVIIGLIVGGILVGQSLIESAQLRALVSQIQKYEAAVNTFKGKYDGELPGDMIPAVAAQFGLFSGCSWQGCGRNDGNPADQYIANNDAVIYMALSQQETIGGGCGGECTMFWRQLSDAHMVEGAYGADLNSSGDPQTKDGNGYFVNSLYMPAAKLGVSYVAIASLFFSATYGATEGNIRAPNENAFYFLTQGAAGLAPILTPAQAQNIDQKIDDGNPTTGSFLMEGTGQVPGYAPYFTNAPTSGYCVSGVTNLSDPTTYSAGQGKYNVSSSTGGTVTSCIPEFVIH